MQKPKRPLPGTKAEKVSCVLWQGKDECQHWSSPGRADSLLFSQQWPCCFSKSPLKVVLTILSVLVLARTSGATDIHPTASPMPLAAHKKDFPPGLPVSFPHPPLCTRHGKSSCSRDIHKASMWAQDKNGSCITTSDSLAEWKHTNICLVSDAKKN